ncbi:hypothetical protein CDV58_04146 [Aspergillus fumigatus]|nr:hypothetical protein CDV58_04146 [Aspergillus fumigatus]
MDQLDSIHFADGFDKEDGLPRLRKLLDSKWNISSDGKGIEKKFHFKNHTNVLDFVHYIGVKCKRKNHHPEAILTYSSLTYKWTTHRPQGLSQKDLEMAEFCDEVAREHIPVVDEPLQYPTPSYTIRLRIENDTSDILTVVKKKKTRWSYANGCTWSVKDDDHVLFIEGSGTSGMLRFKTFSGDFFTLVPGIHNLYHCLFLLQAETLFYNQGNFIWSFMTEAYLGQPWQGVCRDWKTATRDLGWALVGCDLS